MENQKEKKIITLLCFITNNIYSVIMVLSTKYIINIIKEKYTKSKNGKRKNKITCKQ